MKIICFLFGSLLSLRSAVVCHSAPAFVAATTRCASSKNPGHQALLQHHRFYSSATLILWQAQPKRGNVVDSYQTVSVNCAKCRERIFRYKKKNGTKSNLVKCYVERISEDSAGVLKAQEESGVSRDDYSWECPNCQTQFARSALIKGLPALKMVGGKVQMTKK
jgi:hypothetical protein